MKAPGEVCSNHPALIHRKVEWILHSAGIAVPVLEILSRIRYAGQCDRLIRRENIALRTQSHPPISVDEHSQRRLICGIGSENRGNGWVWIRDSKIKWIGVARGGIAPKTKVAAGLRNGGQSHRSAKGI